MALSGAFRYSSLVLVVGLVALAVLAYWQTSFVEKKNRAWQVISSRPQRVMGTSCLLQVVVSRGESARKQAKRALQKAERRLRQIESRMSAWIRSSELSRLNRARPGVSLPLSADTWRVLRWSRRFYEETKEAFDITCRPLIELWRLAGRRGFVPTRAEIRQAREGSHWSKLVLQQGTARKTSGGLRLDLGGIAKGYGLDQAVAAMKAAGARGGLVDVGGDVRVFGLPPRQKGWEVQLRHPFSRQEAATLRLQTGAVCTSGNYARFVQIGKRRYSHILDPRSGQPADAVPSATVVAANATTADVWATALSVLGAKGLSLLPSGVEALLILGKKQAPRAVATPGFRPLLHNHPTFPLHFLPHR